MSVKIARACRMTRHLPKAEAEILSSIPDALIDSLTSKQIAAVMDALNVHWHKARAFEAREILSEGFVWDSRADAFRRLSAPLPWERRIGTRNEG